MHGGLLIALLIEFLVNSIECFKHHGYLMIGISIVYSVVNCSFTFASGTPVYPGIDWVSWHSYLAIVGCGILGCGAFAINYYFWKLVKLPRINKMESKFNYLLTTNSV